MKDVEKVATTEGKRRKLQPHSSDATLPPSSHTYFFISSSESRRMLLNSYSSHMKQHASWGGFIGILPLFGGLGLVSAYRLSSCPEPPAAVCLDHTRHIRFLIYTVALRSRVTIEELCETTSRFYGVVEGVERLASKLPPRTRFQQCLLVSNQLPTRATRI